MKDAIRQRALELGFDDCRFTAAKPPVSGSHYERWLSDGMQGEMAYLERNAHKRLDPQRVLLDAKSMICLAASYDQIPGPKSAVPDALQNGDHATRPANQGVIARYARFTDYHDVLGERLKVLTEFVNQLGGVDTRSLCYLDTGPVLERDFAQRAGLGFIGKHTNLISRKLGNWIFLGEILTTAEIEPDMPERNRCGSCTRCVTACPTRAIIAPFRLDARRCISYLTIELKGSIPAALRPAIGNRIYGCDDGVEVCPWNRFAREGSLMKQHARTGLGTPDLIELLSLDDTGFKARFAGTPIMRTKRRGLLRNVCVALGNVGGSEALPALQKATNNAEPSIAEHARWAIERIQFRAGRNQSAGEIFISSSGV